jgi:hypothetical protein
VETGSPAIGQFVRDGRKQGGPNTPMEGDGEEGGSLHFDCQNTRTPVASDSVPALSVWGVCAPDLADGSRLPISAKGGRGQGIHQIS